MSSKFRKNLPPSNESLFCGDGIDNDPDDQTDGEDPDCQA